MDDRSLWIRQLESMTKSIVERLENISEQELADYVDSRGEIIERILHSPITDNDRLHYKNTIERIIQWDRLVTEKMKSIQAEAKQGIANVNVARKRNVAYYPSYTLDGLYFDKRK